MWLFFKIFGFVLLAFFAVQYLIAIAIGLWLFWRYLAGSWLIPRREIERAADDIIANHPDPALEAFARHEQAWYRSDSAAQTYWYRVRRAIRRRAG